MSFRLGMGFLVALFVALFLFPLNQGFCSTERISQVIVKGHEPVEEQQIRNVITLKEGGSYSEAKEQESLKMLRSWGRFESIKISKEHRADGLIVRFDFLPALIISSIEFSGHFPYLTSRIRRHVGLRVGEVYHHERTIDEVRKVKRFFEREGFFATSIRVKENVNAEKGVVAIGFHIRKGPRLRWGEIHVAGNRVLPDGYFRSKINAWLPYKPSRLRKSFDKIRNKYKKKGYPRVRIRTKKLQQDFKTGKVHIWLSVSEQSHLAVHFHGNRRLSDRTLKKAVTFFQEEAYDLYEVRQSVKEIERAYSKKGFLSAQVQAERTTTGPSKLRVDFYIEEGPQTLVKEIAIIGEGEIPQKNIKKDLGLKEAGFLVPGYLSGPALKSDQRRVPRLLQREGYHEGQLTGTEIKFNEWRDRARVEFEVREGLQTIVQEVDFSGVENIRPNDLRKKLSLAVGSPFSEIALQDDTHRIQNYYADHGYPYAKVDSGFVIDSDSGDVVVLFNVEEGTRVHIGEILIIGIDQTRSSTVRSAMNVDSGDAYSREKILKGESTLRNLGAFASVDVDVVGLKEGMETIHILVKVEERKNYLIDVSASYDTDDKASGSLSITNLNVFGFGKRMNVKATLGFDLRRGEWNYIDPHLLGGDVEMVIGAFLQDEDRPSFQVSDIGGSLSFLRELGRTMSVLAKYELQRSIFRGGTPSADEETEDRTLPHVTLSFNYDSRDYFADPRYGFFGIVSFDYFHTLFGVGADFFKLRGQWIDYRTPFRRFTFVNSLRVEGVIPATTGAVVPRSELLFIGGDYSIRGFEQDQAGPLDGTGTPIGQQFALVLNTELQFRIAGQIKLAGFLDTASTGRNFDLSLDALRHSAGVGIRYITPVGPVRLDYGFVLDSRPDERGRRLHFTFGYAF